MKFLSLIFVLILLGCNTIAEEDNIPKSNVEKLIAKWEFLYKEQMTVDSIISKVAMEESGTLEFRSNKIAYSEMIKPSGEILLDSALWSATETNITLISFDQDTVNLSYIFINDTLKTTSVLNNGETQFDYFQVQ